MRVDIWSYSHKSLCISIGDTGREGTQFWFHIVLCSVRENSISTTHAFNKLFLSVFYIEMGNGSGKNGEPEPGTYPFNPFKLSESRSCHSLAILGPLSLDFLLFPSRVEGQLLSDVGSHSPKSSDTPKMELLLQNLLFPNICKICRYSVSETYDSKLPIFGLSTAEMLTLLIENIY